MLPDGIDDEPSVNIKVLRAFVTGNRVVCVSRTQHAADRKLERLSHLLDEWHIPHKTQKRHKRIYSPEDGRITFIGMNGHRARGLTADLIVLYDGANMTEEIAPIAVACESKVIYS